jgi:hypothetical protein
VERARGRPPYCDGPERKLNHTVHIAATIVTVAARFFPYLILMMSKRYGRWTCSNSGSDTPYAQIDQMDRRRRHGAGRTRRR